MYDLLFKLVLIFVYKWYIWLFFKILGVLLYFIFCIKGLILFKMFLIIKWCFFKFFLFLRNVFIFLLFICLLCVCLMVFVIVFVDKILFLILINCLGVWEKNIDWLVFNKNI